MELSVSVSTCWRSWTYLSVGISSSSASHRTVASLTAKTIIIQIWWTKMNSQKLLVSWHRDVVMVIYILLFNATWFWRCSRPHSIPTRYLYELAVPVLIKILTMSTPRMRISNSLNTYSSVSSCLLNPGLRGTNKSSSEHCSRNSKLWNVPRWEKCVCVVTHELVRT